MKLVQSSVQGAVERDRAVQLLTERAILTRLVCRELRDADIAAPDRRLRSALFLLLRWVGDNQQEFVRTEPQADDGLKHMVAPEGCESLVREIEAGAKVCNALSLLLTADNRVQADHDRAIIRTRLAEYWERHPLPAPVGDRGF